MTFQRFRTPKSGVHAIAAACAAALIIAQCGCGNNAHSSDVIRGEDYLLNTHCEIAIYDIGGRGSESVQDGKIVIQEAFQYARSLENLLSRTIPASDVSAVNKSSANDPVRIGPDAVAVIEKGLHYSEVSGGLFDITIGALAELWDFSGLHPAVPAQSDIDRAVSSVGYKTIQLSDGEVTKQNGDTHIDLGGIAKGYIADRTKAFLEQQGVSAALINFGGNVVVLGNKTEGTSWVIGVEKPFTGDEGDASVRQLSGEISVYSGSVVTSGVYERKFTQGGILYHHILDPATGFPRESDLLSATVIGPMSVDCDALSTTCLMLGAQKAFELVESLEGYEAVLIGRNGKITCTAGALFTPY